MSDHGKPPSIIDSLSSAFEELKLQGSGTAVAFGIRDKCDPMGQPTVVSIDGLAAVSDFLEASPNQVHYLIVSVTGEDGTESRGACKLSYTPASRNCKYNIAGNSKNFHSNVLNADFFAAARDALGDVVGDATVAFFRERA